MSDGWDGWDGLGWFFGVVTWLAADGNWKFIGGLWIGTIVTGVPLAWVIGAREARERRWERRWQKEWNREMEVLEGKRERDGTGER